MDESTPSAPEEKPVVNKDVDNRPIDADGPGVHDLPKRFYSGLWAILVRFFHVPREAPSLPSLDGEPIEAFKPSIGYLNRLRLEFLIGLIVAAAFLIFGVAGISFATFETELGALGFLLSTPIAVALEVFFAMIGFVAIHLRYDTMWYVLNNRSIRLRRGIWTIRETTITFENVQNVSVRQGPIQRLFGIADVLVETAGGGGSADGSQAGVMNHQGLIEGIADPHRIRDLIMSRLRKSKSSGLGDDDERASHTASSDSGFSQEQVELLRQIRDTVANAVH